MPEAEASLNELLAGLKVLAEHGFPKACGSCGTVYQHVEEFVRLTQAVETPTGLQPAQHDADAIEMIRRCQCGESLSTLCADRRSQNPMAQKRRDLFDHLLGILTDGGMPRNMAKSEILKVMRGEPSPLLSREQLQRFFASRA